MTGLFIRCFSLLTVSELGSRVNIIVRNIQVQFSPSIPFTQIYTKNMFYLGILFGSTDPS